jgi:pimeloyl-ACP methyl ester carboxylesterase
MLRSFRFVVGSLLVACLCPPACTPEHHAERSVTPAQGGPRRGAPSANATGEPLARRPCPPNFGALDTCSTLRVPLDWDAPDARQISVFFGKKSAVGEATAQLWLLQGGPGGSGAIFAAGGHVDRLHEALPGVDIYVLEHRGVGESTRLGCSDQEADDSDEGSGVTGRELAGCLDALRAEWGEGLRHFSSSAAARDLAAATDAERAPGVGLFVYGVSYGTYWAIQYLRERPADASGVILDSVATPGVQFFTDFALQYDPVAERLAGLCAADALCRAKMGDDAYGAARAIVARVDAGHCFGDAAAPGAIRALLAEVLQTGGANALVFPLLYRLDRCDQADRDALDTFFSLLLGGPAGAALGPGADSFALRHTIGFSELWSASPTEAEYDARCAEAAFCTPGDFDLFARWPRYEPPATVHELPATEVPVLALNGELDPQTPIEKAERIGAMLQGPAQTFVRLPFGTHFVLANSPVRTVGAPPCGFQLVTSFVSAPTMPPDRACLDDLAAPSFDAPPEVAQSLFGTPDLWENEPDAGEARVALSPRPAWLRGPARRRLRTSAAAARSKDEGRTR